MNKALVLLSGGMKSAIVLYMAKRYNPHVEAILFDCHYTPQRKRDCAKKLAEQAGVFLHEIPNHRDGPDHKGMPLPENMIRPSPVPSWEQVYPGSTQIHLKEGLQLAEDLGCRELYSGVQHSLAPLPFGVSNVVGNVSIVEPLLYLSDHIVVEMAKELDRGCEADMMRVLTETWSCEMSGPRPCSMCRGCLVRALGFTAAGLPDPLICASQARDDYPKEWLNSGLHPTAAQMLKEEQAGNND